MHDASAARDPCRVLVVEDHEDSAVFASRLLRSVGYDVAVANSYAAAMDEVKANRFDVLVCDVGLPDGDGCDLLRHVQSMYDIRGVALTGHAMKKDRERCQRAGFRHFLTKPVTIEQLRNAIDETTEELPCG